MMNTNISPEERRLLILRGIQQDHTNIEIAAEMGVKKWTILNDLRAMKYSRDPELRQAYLDKEARQLASKKSTMNLGEEKFQHMTGMSFKEKNFRNMIDYYRVEIQMVFKSRSEYDAVARMSRDVRKTLKRNEILTGNKGKLQLTTKARDYLRHSN